MATSARQITNYEIRKQIGTGAVGTVYHAYQPSVGRDVALKIILPRFANQPDFVRRFELEAQTIARLEHPHILPLYDYWRDPQGAYLVTRWLPGNLRSAISRSVWSPEEVARLLEQLAGALAIAHREGIVHRDIKPDNILLDEDNNAYLADFGIAVDLSDTIAGEASSVEVVAYLAPEQLQDDVVSARTDVYALGCVAFELLTGRKPFHVTTPAAYIHKQLTAAFPPLNSLRAGLPPLLDEILQTATAKEPAQRYPSAQRFAQAFRAALPSRTARRQTQPLADPLTERELDVLRLIVGGRSNAQIAEQLFLTASTVKWYLKQIYSKLDVHSRAQAIERARSLHLTANQPLSPPVEPTPDAVDEMSATEPENPYKGLRTFQEMDAEDFFGRASLIERLLERLSQAGDGRFLALVGPSGSGKSSVIRAGLIPALRRGALAASPRPFIADLMPGMHPFEELEAALLRVAVNPLAGVLYELRNDPRGLVRAAKRLLPADPDTELVLVVDQFEEMFTLVTDEAVRARFIDNLLEAATDPRSRVRIILTLRADFYDRPLLYPRLAELIRTHTEVIVPMTAQEMEQAMLAPANRVGLRWEPGLAATVMQDLADQPGMLPLLQYALMELYERRDGPTLTLAAYRAMGRAPGALSRRADAIFASLDPAAQALARQLFLRLITLNEGAEDTRRRALQSEFLALGDEGTMEDVIGVFAHYRLLTLDRDPLTHTPTVEIAHEALIREWGRLRAWLAESRDDLRMQRALAQAAAEWAGGDASFLLSGTRLAQYETWATVTSLTLTADERAFLDASIEARTLQAEAEARRQANVQRLERRSRNILHALVAVLLVATVVALGLMAFALQQSAIAQENAVAARDSADYARSMALASSAKSARLLNNPDQALALALAANTTTSRPPAFANSILYETALAPATRRVFEGQYDTFIRVSADGRFALTVGDDLESVRYLDLDTGETVAQWAAPFYPDGLACDIQIAPDGDSGYAVSISPDFQSGAVVEFDLMTGEVLRQLPQLEGGFPCDLAFTPDGQTMMQVKMARSDDGSDLPASIIYWDVADGSVRREVPLDRITSLEGVVGNRFWSTYSPDLQKLLVGFADVGLVGLWDTATGELLNTFSDEQGYTLRAFFTPYGILLVNDLWSHLATSATLWDEQTGERLQRYEWTANSDSAVVSPDGRVLAVGFVAARIALFDLEHWQVMTDLYGHTYRVISLAYTPDGQRMLSGSYDGATRLWNLTHGNERLRLEGLANIVGDFDILPDGKTAAIQEFSPSEPAALTLWNLETGRLIRALGDYENSWRTVAPSPDGKTVAAASAATSDTCQGADTFLRLVDVETGAVRWQVDVDGEIFAALAFTVDGARILAARCDNTITAWDAATGAEIDSWGGHDAYVWTVSASPDGRWVATGSDDTTVLLRDPETGEVAHTLRHDLAVGTVAFSPDSRLLIAVTLDGHLHIWDVETQTEIQQLVGHTSSVWSVQFSPDMRYIASSGGDGNIFVWDWRAGEIIRQFKVPLFSPVGSVVAFSADGRSLYVEIDGGVRNPIVEYDLMLEDGALMDWIERNRYVRELSCEERALYQVEPLCEPL